MKIRDLTILLATSFGAIATVSTIVTVMVLLDNRELRQDMRDMRQSWNAATGESQQLKQERSEAESAFSAQGERLKKVEAELAALKSSLPTNGPASVGTPRAYRAPVFLGQQFLGQGWVAPGQAAKDPNTGQVSYEPVVLLDPSVRAGIAAGKTNVIEREVPTPTTVNYNYPYPYYYWWWPTYWTFGTNGNAGGPPEKPPRFPPPVTRAPPEGGLFLPTKFYRPSEKPFLPPVPQSPAAGGVRPRPVMSPGGHKAPGWPSR